MADPLKGLPILRDMAAREGPDTLDHLDRLFAEAMPLVEVAAP